jgi:transcriptional repressor NrdR
MENKVVDSRISEDGNAIRRRRACEYCDFRFTTYEKISVTDLVIVKRDGSKEIYDRSKLKKSLMLGFAKRTYQVTSLNEMIAKLENKRS